MNYLGRRFALKNVVNMGVFPTHGCGLLVMRVTWRPPGVLLLQILDGLCLSYST